MEDIRTQPDTRRRGDQSFGDDLTPVRCPCRHLDLNRSSDPSTALIAIPCSASMSPGADGALASHSMRPTLAVPDVQSPTGRPPVVDDLNRPGNGPVGQNPGPGGYRDRPAACRQASAVEGGQQHLVPRRDSGERWTSWTRSPGHPRPRTTVFSLKRPSIDRPDGRAFD